MSFTQKQLSVAFSYGSGLSNIYTGLRISARISTPGGQDKGTATIAIYGMSLSDMNALTVLPFELNSVGDNTVTLSAGDEGGAMSTVFSGTVQSAFVDAGAMPTVAFIVSAIAGLKEEAQPAPASSWEGQVDVATLMQSFAQQIGATFENNNVNVKLNFRYYWGSPMQQIRALAREAGIEFIYDKSVLAIWMPGGYRQGNSIMIYPAPGPLVGYPSFSAQGIRLKTTFMPDLDFGDKVTVQSALTPACGDWTVTYMEHALDAQVPHGSWFTTIDASRVGGQNSGGP